MFLNSIYGKATKIRQKIHSGWVLMQTVAKMGLSLDDGENLYRHIDDSDNVIVHTSRYMFSREISRITGISYNLAEKITHSPIFAKILLPIAFILMKSGRNNAHVVVDLVFMRHLYPEIYTTFVDKAKQHSFFDSNNRLFLRTKRYHLKSEKDILNLPEGKIFVKNRYSGWGDDCDTVNREDILRMSEKRRNYLVFEDILHNHPQIQRAMPDFPLVTIRIWTQRWRTDQRDFFACLLVGKRISNSLDNQALPLDANGVCTMANGTKLTIPLYAEAIAASQWCHDRVTGFPFIGWDWAVTEDGLYFIEGNLEASFDRYWTKAAPQIQDFAYSMTDVANFIEELKI